MRLLTRRRFLGLTGAAAAATAGLGVYAWKIEPRWLEVVRRPLPVRRLPDALAGRILVQLSDLHIGRQVDDEYVRATFQRIAQLRPAIVVVTGDIISHHAAVLEQVDALSRELPRGHLATIAVLGNHDYGPGWSHPEIARALVETIAPRGITVLRNDVLEVEGLQIAGLDDLWAGRFDGAATLARLDPHRAALVLSHNPDTVDLDVWRGYEGWILSGHTHGGQCKPPFLEPPLLPVENHRYVAGAYSLAGGRRLYVNRGVGHLLPVRFNVRPEATGFELVRA
ncbi:MAG: metallophosphoesterase [Deltaproteobacteria bacterium]|nr:metallophosphoesterase [Deltaproteobacteria bacterium]